jgi:hypothetical protein
MDYAGRYTAGHARWITLLDGLPDDLPIPATPAWPLLDEWDDHARVIAADFADLAASGIDEAYGRMALVDLCGHEDDLREASGQEHTIDPDDWAVIGVHRRLILDERIRDAGLPPLRVRTPEGDDWTVGGDDAAGVVELPRQELWRSTTGRRTRDAVRSYGWTVDAEPYIAGPWKNYTFAWPEDA